MARDYRLVVRLTDRERQKVEAQARKLGVSMSEVVQDWIKTLPELGSNSQPLLKKDEQ